MSPVKTPIKEWAKDDRPREKLLSKNPEALSDAELLAILIRSGTPGSSALELAREIMKLVKNNFQDLARLTVRDLMKVRGIGQAKAITIAAALEMGRRRVSLSPIRKPTVSTSRQVASWLQARFRDLPYEIFAIILLNNAGKILHFEIISQGSSTGTIVDPRRIIRSALDQDAGNLILCHNHPSGNIRPSKADETLTDKVRQAAQFFDIRLLDHIIVSEEGYFSFADQGKLD